MDNRITLDRPGLPEALETLRQLSDRCDSRLVGVREELGELRRKARAHGRRRSGGNRSTDETKYRLGSALLLAGGGGIDDLALLGLLAHGDVVLCWLAEARQRGPASGLFALLARVLENPAREEWCRQWGRSLWWQHNHALYQAEVERFLASGKADAPNARWRARPATSEQLYLIETIATLLGVEVPTELNRGQAFDWIRSKGGNPRYWAPPERPPDGPPIREFDAVPIKRAGGATND